MKRLVLVITAVLVLISGSGAFAQVQSDQNQIEDQRNPEVENLAKKLLALAEAQLKAVQSLIEDPSYYTYQEPTLTPGEEVIPNGGISIADGTTTLYCEHLDDFYTIEIEQSSIKIVHFNNKDEVLYQGWIVDKHCVKLNNGSVYLKITFLNGTYYESIYMKYYTSIDPDTGVKQINRTLDGRPIYYMD